MVKLFFSYLKIRPRQNFWLFCTSELIRNPFWPKDLFMLPLLHTPTLQPHPKFGTTYGEASILTDMQNLHLLQYSITYTVTEYQNSIHGCFPHLELNLDLWDGSQCFTDRLLRWFLTKATKEFTKSYMYKSIPISSPVQQQHCSIDAFRNCK